MRDCIYTPRFCLGSPSSFTASLSDGRKLETVYKMLVLKVTSPLNPVFKIHVVFGNVQVYLTPFPVGCRVDCRSHESKVSSVMNKLETSVVGCLNHQFNHLRGWLVEFQIVIKQVSQREDAKDATLMLCTTHVVRVLYSLLFHFSRSSHGFLYISNTRLFECFVISIFLQQND